jgi:hypothetical protein
MLKGKNVLSFLKTTQVLGVSRFKERLFQLEDDQVLYTMGHNLVKLDTKTREQDIINCLPSSKEISCLCVNEKKDKFLVAESGQNQCFLSVFQVEYLKLKKQFDVKKTLGFNKSSKKESLSVIR